MTAPDRLALAHDAGELPVPEAGRIAVLRAAPSRFLDAVSAERLICEQSFLPTHRALAARGHAVEAAIDGPAAMVVVNLTRARSENLGNVARGLAMLGPGGLLAVNGAKTDGIDALVRRIAAVLPAEGAFVKAHGRVAWFRRPATVPEPVAEWAAAAQPGRVAGAFLTAPGMFSSEGPDPASLRLAEILPGRLTGRVADLGAGWGWLADAALRAAPEIAAIDLFEAEARALDAARVNVTDPRAGFHWADVTALPAAAGPYDRVVMNPPFHAGRAADPGLGAAFIAAAARILSPRGQLLMVANRQLPYEEALERAFGAWKRLAQDGGYKLFLAERPRRN